MPEQLDYPPLIGGMGDLVYYRRNGKYFLRRKGTLNSKRISTDPAFKLTRLQNALMKRVSTTCAALHTAFAPYTKDIIHQPKLHPRMVGKLFPILKEAESGKAKQLEGSEQHPHLQSRFEWNLARPVFPAILSASRITIDAALSGFEAIVGRVAPEALFPRPKKATHFRIQVVLAAVNAKRRRVKTVSRESALLAYAAGIPEALILSGRVRHPPVNSLLVAGIGVQGYVMVNGIAELVDARFCMVW